MALIPLVTLAAFAAGVAAMVALQDPFAAIVVWYVGFKICREVV